MRRGGKIGERRGEEGREEKRRGGGEEEREGGEGVEGMMVKGMEIGKRTRIPDTSATALYCIVLHRTPSPYRHYLLLLFEPYPFTHPTMYTQLHIPTNNIIASTSPRDPPRLARQGRTQMRRGRPTPTLSRPASNGSH